MKDTLKKAFETLGVNEQPKSDSIVKSVVVGGKEIAVLDFVSKAAIIGDLNGMIANFSIEKTGKEIKEKLVTVKAMDDAKAASCLAMANQYLAKCPSKPTDKTGIGDYELRGAKTKFGEPPVMFSYEDVWAYDEELKKTATNGATMLYGSDKNQKVEKPENCMRLYNQHIRMYVQHKVESLLLDTIIANIDEKKKYQLTAEQASNLMF